MDFPDSIVSSCRKANNDGVTPLLFTAQTGDAAVAMTLLQHRADVHKGLPGWPPFKLAEANKHYEVAELLKSFGGQ